MTRSETAYAKVNLALHVRRRRRDGYHDIESLFAFVDGGDVLRAEPRTDNSVTLSIDGPFAAGLDNGPSNLALRAAEALRLFVWSERHRETRAPVSEQRPSTSLGDMDGGSWPQLGANLYLTKTLPVASGIGGGSADAAAALRLLNRLWACGLDDRQLCAIAESLGSDIPACVISRTLRVEGRGEALEPVDLPGLAGRPVLLVNPAIPLGTAQVFKGWDQQDRGALDTASLAAVIRDGRNDLEAPARALVPMIDEVLAALSSQPGVWVARMSGSGATCFALFESTAAADFAREAMAARYPGWWTMTGCMR